jgi:hypothetical protein
MAERASAKRRAAALGDCSPDAALSMMRRRRLAAHATHQQDRKATNESANQAPTISMTRSILAMSS